MGTDASEAAGTVQVPHYSFKVHQLMCQELMKLVDRISRIFPEIEAARPRCSSGIKALCQLNGTIDKAKQQLQYCSESSKLYLAVTGDSIVKKFHRSKNSLEQSLHEIQNMVHEKLSAEITLITNDLKSMTFILDPSEEEAGKAMRDLLKQDGSTSTSGSEDDFEIQALKIASSRLKITSPKEVSIERRSIRKLLQKVGENELNKKKILMYLFYLLKKHEKSLVEEKIENGRAMGEESNAIENSAISSVNSQSLEDEILSRAVLPQEFRCPISSRLMYDPVTIASGKTYERVYIQKWFDEGNDTCPVTKVKLSHLSMIQNISMKNLISRWCAKYGITISNPTTQPEDLYSWENSMNSIASLGSSLNDIHLQFDFSNMSLGSIDTNYNSYSLPPKAVASGLSMMSLEIEDDSKRCQSDPNMEEADLDFPSNLGMLPWQSQCKVIEDMKNYLIENDQVYPTLSENTIEQLTRFLRDAYHHQDQRAQTDGCELFVALVTKSRQSTTTVHEDTLSLLASLLHSEMTKEALTILEVLSAQQNCRSKFVAAGVTTSILKLIDSQIGDLQEKVLKILCNLSTNNDICSHIVSLGCIPKLVPLFKNGALSIYCIHILDNLGCLEEARASIAETNGCITSVSQVLESGSLEDQEHAVMTLLSLCSQRVEYCQLVMAEGIIPCLVGISINGSNRGKVGAMELLRLLRDIIDDNGKESHESDLYTVESSNQIDEHEPKQSKSSVFLGRKIQMFSKPNSQRKKK